MWKAQDRRRPLLVVLIYFLSLSSTSLHAYAEDATKGGGDDDEIAYKLDDILYGRSNQSYDKLDGVQFRPCRNSCHLANVLITKLPADGRFSVRLRGGCPWISACSNFSFDGSSFECFDTPDNLFTSVAESLSRVELLQECDNGDLYQEFDKSDQQLLRRCYKVVVAEPVPELGRNFAAADTSPFPSARAICQHQKMRPAILDEDVLQDPGFQSFLSRNGVGNGQFVMTAFGSRVEKNGSWWRMDVGVPAGLPTGEDVAKDPRDWVTGFQCGDPDDGERTCKVRAVKVDDAMRDEIRNVGTAILCELSEDSLELDLVWSWDRKTDSVRQWINASSYSSVVSAPLSAGRLFAIRAGSPSCFMEMSERRQLGLAFVDPAFGADFLASRYVEKPPALGPLDPEDYRLPRPNSVPETVSKRLRDWCTTELWGKFRQRFVIAADMCIVKSESHKCVAPAKLDETKPKWVRMRQANIPSQDHLQIIYNKLRIAVTNLTWFTTAAQVDATDDYSDKSMWTWTDEKRNGDVVELGQVDPNLWADGFPIPQAKGGRTSAYLHGRRLVNERAKVAYEAFALCAYFDEDQRVEKRVRTATTTSRRKTSERPRGKEIEEDARRLAKNASDLNHLTGKIVTDANQESGTRRALLITFIVINVLLAIAVVVLFIVWRRRLHRSMATTRGRDRQHPEQDHRDVERTTRK